MTDSTRIPVAEVTGIDGAIMKQFSKKRLGQVPTTLGVMWHHKPVLRALLGFSRKAENWERCDPQLKSFAHMAAVSLVGCSFCLDFGYFQAHNDNLDVDKAREVPRWRESDVFTPLERDVFEYAEAMSQTPLAVTDDLSGRLLEYLGAAGLVELTAFVGAANLASRTNIALGIKSQGFAEACGLDPLPTFRGQ